MLASHARRAGWNGHDVLNIEDPLTLEVFEAKEDVILIGLEWPTPPPPPRIPPTMFPPPKVRPLLFNPLVSKISRHLGYHPLPQAPATVNRIPVPVNPRTFNTAIYFYNGTTVRRADVDDHIEHLGATFGYRTQGTSAQQIPIIFPCPCSPWSLDVDVDFNSSVFDSQFLEFEYLAFLDQIGYVPGMAASLKSMLGPTSVVLEWNGAINRAEFTDDVGVDRNITPQAWQVSVAYQFDWNPGITTIGTQGTYVTLSYSESQDLAGARREIRRLEPGTMPGDPGMTTVEQVRVGFAPEKRLLVGLGEWVLDGLRVAFEYSYNVDYPMSAGGTGRSADAYTGMLTYEW